MKRQATIERSTKETKIKATVDLDGTGAYDMATGIGFLDHMLEQLARHSLIDITLKAKGDLHIDFHHTTEDCGIVLGQAVAKALGDKQGIARYAGVLPADGRDADAGGGGRLGPAVPDLEGGVPARPRSATWTPSCSASGSRPSPRTPASRCTSRTLYGENSHHIAETCFKGLARALRAAIAIDPRQAGPGALDQGDAVASNRVSGEPRFRVAPELPAARHLPLRCKRCRRHCVRAQ